MLCNLLAKLIAKPVVANAIIRYAMKHPYMHLDGYMNRYWVFNPTPPENDGKGKRFNWLPSIRVHHILREDRDRHMHDHPWNARTFILRGWYIERRPVTIRPTRWVPKPPANAEIRFTRMKGDTARIRFGQYHSIDEVSKGGVWTLFVMFNYQGTWGFRVNGKKIPWRDYLKEYQR